LAWWLYMVRCADGTLYTGIATDVQRRLAEHNRGQGARYTRGRGPVTLVYLVPCASQGDATRKEAAIKRLPRRVKENLLAHPENQVRHIPTLEEAVR
jgi:putative endonuclease